MDFRKPLVAQLKAAFLNPPLFFLLVEGGGVLRVGGLGGTGGLAADISFLIPEGPGVTGSIFVLAGVTGSVLIFLVPVLMSCFNSDSKGASTMASSGSGAPTPSGGRPHVRIRFVSRTCSLARGLIILTAVALGILGFFKIKCFSAANRLALFNRALCEICPL